MIRVLALSSLFLMACVSTQQPIVPIVTPAPAELSFQDKLIMTGAPQMVVEKVSEFVTMLTNALAVEGIIPTQEQNECLMLTGVNAIMTNDREMTGEKLVTGCGIPLPAGVK